MSVEAISWALNLAPIPRDTNGKPNPACVSVLIGLANNADSSGRDAFPSVNTLVRYTRLSERTVRTCLDRLAAEGIIREGDPAIVAAKIKRGDRRPQIWDLAMELIRDDLSEDDLSTLERIYPGITDRAGNARLARSERGATTAPRHEPNEMNGVQPTQERGATTAPKPYIEPSLIKQEDTYVSSCSDTRSPRGRNDSRRPSTRSSARGRRESADDELDPAKAVIERPSEPEPYNRRADTSMSLVAYFYDRLKNDSIGARAIMTIPDPINKRKLAATFSRWKRSGTTADDIRAMIDNYTPDTGMLTRRIPPWLDLLARRAQLAGRRADDQILNDPTSQAYLDYWGITEADLEPIPEHAC